MTDIVDAIDAMADRAIETARQRGEEIGDEAERIIKRSLVRTGAVMANQLMGVDTSEAEQVAKAEALNVRAAGLSGAADVATKAWEELALGAVSFALAALV